MLWLALTMLMLFVFGWLFVMDRLLVILPLMALPSLFVMKFSLPRSFADHPIHLHGHHIHVLSKNGKSISGSPLVLDTLLVEPGETFEVAFTADNPGLWMDHCHNLEHAALGMTMHLAYENVTSPFTIGDASENHPE